MHKQIRMLPDIFGIKDTLFHSIFLFQIHL